MVTHADERGVAFSADTTVTSTVAATPIAIGPSSVV